MLQPEHKKLIEAASAVQGSFSLREPDFSAAAVGAALRTTSGVIHTGVCVDLACGIGFCAEHAAIAEMLKHREVEIAAIVAVNQSGILSPCGRCREFMAQLTPRNMHTQVIMPGKRLTPLRELLPDHWLVDNPTRHRRS